MIVWRPSYCRCAIEEVMNGTQIVGGGRVLTKCTAHSDIPDSQLYDILLNGESRPAMDVFKQLRITFPVEPINFAYRGQGQDREMVIMIEGITQQQKNMAVREAEKVTSKKLVIL